MRVYSIYDKKALAYSPVLSFPNDVFAIRACEADLRNSQSVYSQYPSDFCLVHVADFDDVKGILTPVAPLEVVYEFGSFEFKPEN